MSAEYIPESYRAQVTDFKISGNWKFIGYWQYPAYSRLASVNGQLCIVTDGGQFIPVAVYGENYGSCACCGYMPLCNHYLIKDIETGKQVNVGSECLPKVLGKIKGEEIKKTVESIKRKVSTDYRRPIKNEQLKAYVLQVYDVEKARDKRKARILQAVQENPELYKPSINDINGKQIYFKSEEQRTKDGINWMNKDINFWANMRDHYKPLGQFWDNWNPDTMIRQMKKEAEKDGLTIPKWRPLTKEEQEQEDKLILDAINDFTERLNKKYKEGY